MSQAVVAPGRSARNVETFVVLGLLAAVSLVLTFSLPTFAPVASVAGLLVSWSNRGRLSRSARTAFLVLFTVLLVIAVVIDLFFLSAHTSVNAPVPTN